MSLFVLLLLLLLQAGPSSAPAQGSPSLGEKEFPRHSSGEKRRTRSVFVEKGPQIDGILDDPCWREAAWIGPLRQVEPQENAPPSEKTRILLCHDKDHLFLGILCFDRHPGNIRGTMRERDARLDPDDRVEILLDTFHDGRSAYFFQIGAGGSIGDALVGANGRAFTKQWDGIFYGRSRITPRGWEAEISIPFATIRFDPASPAWGFNVQRHIKAKNEIDRWNAPFRNRPFFVVSNLGELRGMREIRQGTGISFRPYAALEAPRERGRGSHLKADAGGDLFFSITPSFTGVLTVNTDFAETEVDARRFNLTRFPLFFPEKRDFFLEAQPSFSFGFAGNDLIPFFSRRVGRGADGRPVTLEEGAKLVGGLDGFGVGFLGVHTAGRGETPPKDLAACRLTRSIGKESSLGVIGTLGNPEGREDNSLGGMDLDLRTSTFLGDKNLSLRGYALKSETQGIRRRQWAYGTALGFENEPFGFRGSAEEIQEGFHPALGFVRRKGVRRYKGGIWGKIRPGGGIRWISPGVSLKYHEKAPGGRTEDWVLGITPVDVTLESGDSFLFTFPVHYDYLPEPFPIHEGVTIAPGSYRTAYAQVRGRTADKRPASGGFSLARGTFYSGTLTRFTADFTFRPGALLQAGLTYDVMKVVLEEGDFQVHIAGLKTTLTPTPDLAWKNYLQYDNVSGSLGLNSRLRWILEEGNDLFLVFNQDWDAGGGVFYPQDRNIAVKLSWTLLF